MDKGKTPDKKESAAGAQSFDLGSSQRKREFFDWVEKAAKAKGYAVHISCLVEKPGKADNPSPDLVLESFSITNDCPLEDLVTAVKKFKAYADAQMWRE